MNTNIDLRHIIKEAIGVHEDVKTLAEFIYKFFHQKEKEVPHSISDAMKSGMDAEEYIKYRSQVNTKNEKSKRGTYIFHKEGMVDKGTGEFDQNWSLPSLKDMKIHELKVNYKPKSWLVNKGTQAFFDIGSSEMTDKGLVLSVTFIAEPQLSVIYHELTHALQYSKLGREKHIKGLMPHKTTTMSKSLVKKEVGSETEANILQKFVYYVYYASENEITAKVTETYAELKELNTDRHRLKDVSRYDDSGLNEPMFSQYLKLTDGYRYAKKMMEYDVFSEFSEMNSETTILFFSFIKDNEKNLDLSATGFKKLFRITKLIGRAIKFSYGAKPQMLSEDEVISMMKKYNTYINKQGEKLYRKLTKLYGHFG